MERIVTGIQPTGTGSPHLGNYLGAIKQITQIIDGSEPFVMVADAHATTTNFSPKDLKEASLVTAAALIASGVPGQYVFKQSCIPAHFELSTYLSHLATIGPMERMTQFKDKSQKSSNRDAIGFGLLNYPILMAADILVYNATVVPVGKDQHQHLQLTVDLAKKLNRKVGEKVVNVPKMRLVSSGAKIQDLLYPEKKMSKSAENQNGILYLSDDRDTFTKKIKRCVTDTKPYFDGEYSEQSDGLKNIINIISCFTNKEYEEICLEFNGKRYSELKEYFIELYDVNISPIRDNMNALLSNRDELISIIKIGNERSRETSNKIMNNIRDKIGLGI